LLFFFYCEVSANEKKKVKARLNSLFKLVIQLSVAEFHFAKGGHSRNGVFFEIANKRITLS